MIMLECGLINIMFECGLINDNVLMGFNQKQYLNVV